MIFYEKGGLHMHEIAIISGSPFQNSRTDGILRYLERTLIEHNIRIHFITVSDVSAEDLIGCNFNSPIIQEITEKVKGADGVIVGSPVYKSAYSGVLKTLIDLLPQDVFEGKPVLPVMTGGSKAHLLALEYTLKPLISSLKGHTLKGIYLVESEIDLKQAQPILDTDVRERTLKQLDYFTEFIEKVSDRPIESK